MRWSRRLARQLAGRPVTAHPRDRVLVCGDGLANFGLHPTRTRLVLAPAALSSDDQQNRRSAARLAGLRPRLACFGHGFALRDPGRFADPVDQLGSASS